MVGVLNATESNKFNITELYIATFDRSPDSAGLQYWVNTKLSIEEIAQSFFDQQETKEKYPEALSEVDFIQAVYQNLFNRSSDSDGFEYWYKELNSHSVHRSVFILVVINGALENDDKLLANKTKVGLAYAEAGRDDIDEAHKVLLDITHEVESVSPVLCAFNLSNIGCSKPSEKPIFPMPPVDNSTDEDTPPPADDTSTPPPPPPPPPSNTKPVANAGENQSYLSRNISTDINGTGSDADGDNLTYLWSVTDSPNGSNPTIADNTSANTIFTSDIEGVYTLSLVVNDGTDNSIANTLTLTILPSTLKRTVQINSSETNDDGICKAGVAHSYTATTVTAVAGDNIVTDNITNLVWQDSNLQTDKKWQEAIDYCNGLDFAGSTDWRLPTVKELVYIIDSSTTTNPAGVFTDTTNGFFWSSTTYADNDDYAWGVYFGDGSVYGDGKDYAYSVRCVRGG